MLGRYLVFCTLFSVFATPTFAEETTPETSVQLYNVADLVTYGTPHESMERQISPAEWQSQHVETIQSLDRLAALVKGMSSTKWSKVEAYPETLSLVVRNTADGHREIHQLLKLLRTANQPSIRLTCYGTDIEALPEDRAVKLWMKKTLTSDEAREAKELFGKPDFANYDQTLQLAAGRKTAWGMPALPATATASVVPGKRSIQLRIDYVSNNIGDKIPVKSQVFEIEEGHSAISLQTCDGGTVMWLITPTRIEPKAPGDSTAIVK